MSNRNGRKLRMTDSAPPDDGGLPVIWTPCWRSTDDRLVSPKAVGIWLW